MADSQIFKVSVLGSEELLLDGEPVTLTELEHCLTEQAGPNAAVWYYRENGVGHTSPVADEVLRLFSLNRLPIKLSARPDFSSNDQPVTADQIERQRRLEVEERFRSIRQKASQRQLVVVRPDDRYLFVPAMKWASKERVAMVESLLPSDRNRNVAVIADTSWSLGDAVGLQTAHQAIPFFGILMALTYIGHAVWIFNGRPELLSAGCREAALLIVDDRRIPALPPGWDDVARETMLEPEIVIHDSANYELRRQG